MVEKCKTTDIPAVNSRISNIQKALQKYVGFSGMDPKYCERIGELMDRAQAWCLDIKELYVGIFSDNSQVTVFEFLESAELVYLGWGNSI